MGKALVFKDADFSANALRQISFVNYAWDDIQISSGITHKDGYIYGAVNSASQPGGKVETGVASSWGGAWGYTDLIAIPTGAERIRGVLSEIDLILSGASSYSFFPMIVFYNSGSYISEINSADLDDVDATFYHESVAYKTKGYKGSFECAIPANATHMRVQWVTGRSASDTVNTKMGDTTAVRIDMPTSLEFGTPIS